MSYVSYPHSSDFTNSDYITFDWYDYQPNIRQRGALGSGDDYNFRNYRIPGRNASGGGIRMYMPESTPPAALGNTWEEKRFEGPLGKIIARAIAGKNPLEGSAAKDVAGQVATNAIAGMFGMTGGQLTAMRSGKVFNPNVELLYNSPQLRQFQFQFNMVPRNKEEAVSVRRIMKLFKIYSSPALASGNMLEVPKLWDIRYSNPDMMGKFKGCALTNVTTQANGSSAYHTTFRDGMPVEYSLGLMFMETDFILREDLADGVDSVGY